MEAYITYLLSVFFIGFLTTVDPRKIEDRCSKHFQCVSTVRKSECGRGQICQCRTNYFTDNNGTFCRRCKYRLFNTMVGWSIGLWCLLLPLSTISQLFRGGHFYWWRQRRKPPTWQASSHNVVSSTSRHKRGSWWEALIAHVVVYPTTIRSRPCRRPIQYRKSLKIP